MNAQHKTPETFAFYLVPEFTMLAFTSAVEALRIANDVLGYKAYQWRVLSADGGNVRSTCGLSMGSDHDLAAERKLPAAERASTVVVCTGQNVERYSNKALSGWLRECFVRKARVGSLCTGAHLLAEAGLLDDRRCTIHWENAPGFAERFIDTSVNSGIYEIDGNIFTCAGGTASFDMMLHIIQQDFGDAVVDRVCELALVDRVRKASDRQRLPLPMKLGLNNLKIIKVAEQIEANLVDPVPIEQLARHTGLSRRQIERLFHKEVGRSPARYYLERRLERARLLLVQSAMPIVEIAVACGFISGSHFSKCYRDMFGCSPQETRSERKQSQHLPAARDAIHSTAFYRSSMSA